MVVIYGKTICYTGNPADDSVEISFVVHEDFQKRGMGSYLCRKLFDYAKEKGIIFLSTPFDDKAIEELNPLMEVYKISSDT